MSAWYITPFLSYSNYYDFVARILVAAVCGALIGIEREKRLKNAGLRTHIIVAVTAALTMIISKYAYFDVTAIEGLRLQADASRTAHGVISAIGFLGAGVIFVRKDSIQGLTTAAGLWATVAIGLTIGAGMYLLGVVCTLFIIIIQAILHKYHMKTRDQMIGDIKCNVTKHNMTVLDFEKYLTDMNVKIRDIGFVVNDNNETIVDATVIFPPEKNMKALLEQLSKDCVLDKVDLTPAM